MLTAISRHRPSLQPNSEQDGKGFEPFLVFFLCVFALLLLLFFFFFAALFPHSVYFIFRQVARVSQSPEELAELGVG